MKFQTFCCTILFLITINLTADSSYRGKGEAVVEKNNLPDAKQAALNDAFKNAVQRAVGVYVKSQTTIENIKVKSSKILSESEGYIKNYKIIKEEVGDGIYSVEIEAEVYSEKIETAFSQRIDKFIEKNLIGPAGINISITRSKGNFAGISINFHMPINDPTIEMDSIMLGLPVSGWVKPTILSMGTINLMHYGQSADLNTGKILIKDVIAVLETRKAEVKLKNPANDKVEVRPLMFDRFNSVYISDETAGSIPKCQMTKFKDYGEDNVKKMLEYLRSIDK